LKPRPDAAAVILQEDERVFSVRLLPFNSLSDGFGDISETIPPL